MNTIELTINERQLIKDAITAAIADKEAEKQEYLNRGELTPSGKKCLGLVIRTQNELMQLLAKL